MLLLMISWMHHPLWEYNSRLDVVELFAGQARISKLCSWLGWRCRAHDLSYHQTGPVKQGCQRRSCMDVNGAAGMTCLPYKHGVVSCWHYPATIHFRETKACFVPSAARALGRSARGDCCGLFELECCQPAYIAA